MKHGDLRVFWIVLFVIATLYDRLSPTLLASNLLAIRLRSRSPVSTHRAKKWDTNHADHIPFMLHFLASHQIFFGVVNGCGLEFNILSFDGMQTFVPYRPPVSQVLDDAWWVIKLQGFAPRGLFVLARREKCSRVFLRIFHACVSSLEE